MTNRLLAGMATLVAAGAVAIPALAASPNAAQKEPFLDNFTGRCATGAISGDPTENFAVIKQNGDGTVSAEVSLKHAVPNATYRVEIAQAPSGAGCNVFFGTIQTNGQGNGNGQFSVPIVPGSTGANVGINLGDDLQATPNYVFGSK